jgi:ribonuclease HII
VVFPDLNIEKKLWIQGYRFVAGVDEVGRGSWAGPVVAAGVVFPQDVKLPEGLRDSKLLTSKRREELDKEIREISLALAVGECGSPVIEEKGIAVAAQLAMSKALDALDPQPDFSLIDYFELDSVEKSRQRGVEKGDLRCASISAASIIAKVYRDDLMRKLDDDEEFKVYQFGKHKGYGTKLHQQLICEHGVCGIHRISFVPEELR